MSVRDRRVVVSRDDYTIAFAGPVLSEATYDVDGLRSFDTRAFVQSPPGLTTTLMGVNGTIEALAKVTPVTLAGNAGWRALGLPGEEADISGISIYHLHVQDEWRRQGIGSFLFDGYLAAAVYVGEFASGHFGGGDESVEFLRRQGIPEDDITGAGAGWMAREAVRWQTDASALAERDPGVTVEGLKGTADDGGSTNPTMGADSE